MTRMALAQTSTEHKLLALVVPLALAFDIAIIINCDDSRAPLAWGLSLIISLITGNRVYVLLAFLVAVYRWRPKLGGWKLLAMGTSCGVVLFSFKLAYAVWLAWWHGNRIDPRMIYDNMQMSLSALDAQASYLICLFYLQGPSPLWMGSTYYEIPFYLTWPRFLGGHDVSTLAESYIRTHHNLIAVRGGGMAFSAIAEAWLNFGWLGTVFLGNLWGMAARFFDGRSRGICYYLFLILTVRLFRSDFATLYKNWIIVWGSLFVVALILLMAYTVLTEARHLSCHAGGRRIDSQSRPRCVG
jgi:hypothetical protein